MRSPNIVVGILHGEARLRASRASETYSRLSVFDNPYPSYTVVFDASSGKLRKNARI